MKKLPKSKLGAALAALYLIIAGFLLFGVIFGDGGLHGDAAASFIYAILLTSPWSWVWLSILFPIEGGQLQGGSQNSLLYSILAIAGLPVCALINAAIIYVLGGLASRAFQSLRAKTVDYQR